MELFRLLVLVDMPDATRHERKVKREFGEQLFKMGYSLLQEGVYVRSIEGRANANARMRRLQTRKPEVGKVRAFVMTESQFAAGSLLAGREPSQETEIGSQLDIFL